MQRPSERELVSLGVLFVILGGGFFVAGFEQCGF